jgi:hypothetical protein
MGHNQHQLHSRAAGIPWVQNHYVCHRQSNQACALHPNTYHNQCRRHSSPIPKGGLETPWDASSSGLRQRPTVHRRELYKLLGIKLAMSTAYHPQTDGQTEHIN